jgi:hypothetical protein
LGPLPKAVELPMSDVGTPSIGEGGGIVPASWDRGHGGLQVQAQENTGRQPHTRLLPTEWGGDGADVAQTGRHPPHRCGEGANATQVLRQGGSQPQSTIPRNRHSAGTGTQVPAKELGPTLTPG